MHTDIAIIGGGIMGVSTALALARDPAKPAVALFERRELAAGSSGRSGAILRCHYADRAVAELARDGLAAYARFEGETGRPIGFTRCGVLTLAGPAAPEWIEKVQRNTQLLRSLGIDARLLEAAELRALVPGLRAAQGAIGCWEPEGGFVDPRAAVAAFAAEAQRLGAELHLAAPALRLWIEGGRCRGIESERGRVEAARVLVAAGPWTRALLAQHGLELPLEVVRPEQVFFALPKLEPASKVASAARVPHPVLIDLEHGFYTRCEPDRARTRASYIDYAHDLPVPDPDRLDEHIGPATRAWARAALGQRLPAYAQQAEVGAEAAWYTLSPDSMPLLGALPGIEGLWVACGFSGHGFKLAPGVGAGLAQQLLGQPVTAFDAAFFAPERFARSERAQARAFGL